LSRFKPVIFKSFTNYNKNQFSKDVQSGIIISIIALPLSIALAVASGLQPEQGIYTAIFMGFTLALLSGSPVQIGGPTGTFLVITLAVMTKYGFTGLFIVTVLSSLILILMGLLGLGKIIKFIPYPVISGFKVGIAIVILLTQINDFLGIEKHIIIPTGLIDRWIFYFKNINLVNSYSVLIGIITILIIIGWSKLKSKIPGSFVALIVTSTVVFLFKLDIPTLGSTFTIKNGLMKPLSLLDFNLIKWDQEFLSLAVTLAILCAMEALLSAVVADGMIDTKHNSNTELISEGLANIVSVIFCGLPGVGAIARTATNVKNGGRTPVAAIVHCVILLIIILFLTPLLSYIPLATLAGILFVVSYNMSDIKSFIQLFKAPKSDIAVLWTTLILTVVVDLAYAVQVSMVLASLLFMKRMSDVTEIGHMIYEDNDKDGLNFLESLPPISESILIYRLNGPFFFGAADQFVEAMNTVHDKHRVIILRMRHVPAMDATAMHALRNIYKKCKSRGIQLILSGVQEQPFKVMDKADFIKQLGHEYVFNNINEAIEYANKIV
jgi:sulfate permease, SulP family